jgi:hypothetical protein
MKRRVLLAFGLIVGLAVAGLAVPALRHALLSGTAPAHGSSAAVATPSPSGPGGEPQTMIQTPPPSTSPPAPPGPRLQAPANPASITASGTSLFEWALLDRETNKVVGSAHYTTKKNTVESMIKPGIAADWLRREAAAGRTPSQTSLNEIIDMIEYSNDHMAEKYYQLGGADAVINRLIKGCGLTSVQLKSGLWSWTLMSTQDMIRYGACLGDGRAAGPKWTAWLLDVMRHVKGGVPSQISHDGEGGHWGIIDGLPPELAKDTSIKNGWTLYRADGWHVNCLAVHPDFVLSIEIRTTGSLQHAADICKATTQKLVVKPSP